MAKPAAEPVISLHKVEFQDPVNVLNVGHIKSIASNHAQLELSEDGDFIVVKSKDTRLKNMELRIAKSQCYVTYLMTQ